MSQNSSTRKERKYLKQVCKNIYKTIDMFYKLVYNAVTVKKGEEQMATLISFYKDNKITSSEAETKDISIILGFIFKKYVQGEDITESFDSKFLYIEDSQLKMKPLNKKINQFLQNGDESVDALIKFEELAKGYDEAYIFDQYEIFKFENDDYKDLDERDYKLSICKHCGKIISGPLVNDYCPECFITYGVQEVFEQVQSDDKELYTEYETVSKVMNTIEAFYDRVKDKGTLAVAKAREISEQYLGKEQIPEELYETVLGGFAA